MEERRSISISYKADLKDLISKLKQMPNVTEAEAKKMVAALDNQLQNAEKAAEEASRASQAAAEAASQAAQEAAEDLEGLQDGAEDAASRFEELGESTGDVEGGFSSLADTIGIFNPELGESIQGLGDAAAAGGGLLESLGSLNPVLLGGTAIVAGLTMAYSSYEAGVQAAKEATLELREANELLQISQGESEDNMVDAASKLRELRMEYKLLTGQITQYEFDLEKAGEAANESFTENINILDDSIENNKLLLKSVESLQGAYLKLKESPAMTEEEMESIRLLQLQNDEIDNQVNLMDRGLMQAALLGKLRDDLRNKIATESKMVKAVTDMRTEAVNTAMDMVTLEKELADATEEAANQAERRAEAAERALTAEQLNNEALEEAFALVDDILKGKALEEQMDRAMAAAFLDDEGKKQIAQAKGLEDQIRGLEMLGLATGREAEAQLAAIALRRAAEEDLNEELLAAEEELQAQRKEGARANLDAIFELGDALATLADARMNSDAIDVEAQKEKQKQIAEMGEIERSAYEQKQKQLRALFRFEKGMALANVAMATAEAIMAAQALIPPFNAIQSGIALATGIAQSGVVMSQQMPSFHMGGMAPDEATARVLRGEAILDRSTVRRIGGEQGVRNLQQGGSSSTNTVVIQPFKHFGRFAKDLGISKAQPVGIRGY
jgi:hypothetical protein